jgi:hypothetical protein
VAPLALITAMPVSAGLLINLNFTSNFNADFGSNAGAAQNAALYAAQQFENLFSDPIQVNITVDAVTGTGTLGQSSQNIFNYTYAQLQTALVNDAKSTDDQTAVGAGGSVSATDPTNNAGFWWVTRAQEKALGLIASDANNDGTVTFGSGFTYTFDPLNRSVPGAIDFIGVVEHEISEIMGRIGVSGNPVGSNSPSYTILDEFAYTGAATRGLNFVGNDFFSIDNGNTLLKQFNQVPGGDSRDWQSGTNDSFNAFSSSGVQNGLSPVDIRELDVIGYDLAAPEPGTIAMLGAGLSLILARRLRRKK